MTKIRCAWAQNQFPDYVRYHDEEWGVPVHEDQTHFEFLILEGAQAGLSWSTILKKREGYRQAFADFDPEKVARYDEGKIQELLLFPGIVRNQLKIRSAVSNAQLFLKIQKDFGSFDAYIWSFVEGQPLLGFRKSMVEVPATTKESDLLSQDLKKRGFKFAGSTVMYAHMQACGLVMDHTLDCFRFAELAKL